MAEGGTLQRSFKNSLSKASGDAEEAFCDPCINRGRSIAVQGYCQICQEYLCDICLGVHKNQRLTRSHSILDKNQMPREQGPYAKQDLCVEVCKTHHPEIVRFYCKAHDDTGCVDCMTLNHSSCKKDRVQDISDEFQATNEFKLIQQKLDEFHKELEVMKDALDDNLKNLDTTYNNIQQRITSYRKHINDYLDQIQEQITDEAAEMKKSYETETNKQIAKIESMKSELTNILQKIQNDSDVNVNSIFVITKQAQQRVTEMESEITQIDKSQPQQHNYGFRPSIEIEKLVSANIPLGNLIRKPNVFTTASYRGTINVKTRTDQKHCLITDCTLLEPNRMVVTDGNNKNIKLIDISNKTVISSYQTSVSPQGVTAVSSNQVAVTLPGESKIQLFNVASTFNKQLEIQVNNDCYDTAYKDGKFAVTYVWPEIVKIMDIQGRVLNTLQPKYGKDYVLKCPRSIVFGPDKDTVIVSDYSTNIVTVLTLKGHILRSYTHNTLKDPHGILVTPDGVLFVCSTGTDSIHVVSSDFKTSKTIINNDNNVVNPKSITYCDINHRLYISNRVSIGDMNDTITVYDLNVNRNKNQDEKLEKS